MLTKRIFFSSHLKAYLCFFLNFFLVSFSQANQPLIPLERVEHNTLKVKLGEKLFNDNLLSEDRSISCGKCHQASKGFADGKDFSLDTNDVAMPLNTPGLQYVGLNHYYTWTGKAHDLKEHLSILIASPRIMNNNWQTISQRLASNAEYVEMFANAGYQTIDKDSISDAIVTFEQSLARLSRFDFYLKGDSEILTKQEIRGYRLFNEYGCSSCHQGRNIGGNMRQLFGVMQPYFNDTNHLERDLGYFNSTKQPGDKYYFRVPSLRNVSKTAPYFHNASAKTLSTAIKVMFEYQLGIIPSSTDVNDIKAFLKSLDSIDD